MKKIITFVLVMLTIHISAQEIKFGKVSEAELKEKFHPIDSTASAAYLYRFRNTSYEYNVVDGFVIVTKAHERIKIYNKKGLRYATKLISYYKPESGSAEEITGIKGYTFNLEKEKASKEKLTNSQIFDEKKTNYRSNKKIAMPAVKVGSVIDLKYEIRSSYLRDVEFQFGIPVKEYITKVQIPEYYEFKNTSKGYYHIASKKSSSVKAINFSLIDGSTTKLSYKTKNDKFAASDIPALKDNEPYAGNIKNYRGGFSYELSTRKLPNSVVKYYSTTWEDVSKTIYKSSGFGSELSKVGYFKNELVAVLANLNTENEKLSAILKFVKSKVKWNGYYGKYTNKGVKKAFKDGVGNVADINLLLTAMLREAGLNAEPVLVSSKNNVIPLYPSRRGFNYVISMVALEDGKQVLLDATEPLSVPNVLPSRVLNWKGRLMKNNGESFWVNLTTSQNANKDTKLYVKFTEDYNIKGLQKNTFFRNEGLNYRLNKNSIEKTEEKYGLEIDDFKVINLDDLRKPVIETIRFTVDNLIEEVNNKLYINPLLYLTIKENPFKSKERKFPVDYVTPWQKKYLVNITIPEGYKVEFVPESLAIGLPDNLGFFKLMITVSGKVINVQSIMKLNEALIAAKYYPDLKEFYRQIVSKNLEKIILVKE